MHETECYICEKDLTKLEKVYQDRYLFNVHCSWECTVKSMSEFFDVEEGKPNLTVINGKFYYEDSLDENGNPIEY